MLWIHFFFHKVSKSENKQVIFTFISGNYQLKENNSKPLLTDESVFHY